MHGLQEAGIPVSLRVHPKLDAVKAAHAERASGVELYTGAILDLPQAEQKAELEALNRRQNWRRSPMRFGWLQNCACESRSVAGSATRQPENCSTVYLLRKSSRLAEPQYRGRYWWVWIGRFEI